MKYLIIRHLDNGYSCSCCHKEWIEVEEIDYSGENYTEEEKLEIDRDILKSFNSKDAEIYRVEKTLKEREE